MDRAHTQAFLRRPWDSLAAPEREHWAREFARRGPVSRLLREHMRRVRPDRPSDAERREDLSHHIALKSAIDRAARALGRSPLAEVLADFCTGPPPERSPERGVRGRKFLLACNGDV